MSPVTHFLASWVFASLPHLERRDLALVAFAGIAPDIDGIGIVPELLTRHSTHPLDCFSRYHSKDAAFGMRPVTIFVAPSGKFLQEYLCAAIATRAKAQGRTDFVHSQGA